VSHPPLSEASLATRRELVALGARYHRAGWLFGTSGNLSARINVDGETRVVVTASGRDKGHLGVDDFVEVTLEGELRAGPPGGRPSAETTIHLAIYRTRPDANVALHVHTVASTLAIADEPTPGTPRSGRVQPPDQPRLTFTGLELIKGWNLWDEGAVASLPVFPNHSSVPAIANEIAAFYKAFPHEPVPSLLITSHGITSWGHDAFTANRHLEVTEFLCQVALARRSLSR
jgi:methylthioribulose-1-phosphate dehydratase